MSQIEKDLVDMLKNLSMRWEVSNSVDRDALLAQTYVAICAELRAQRPFLQLGNEILRKDDIIRAVIVAEEQRYSAGRNVVYKKIKVTLRELDTDEGYGSSSVRPEYDLDSLEGKSLLEWLQGQSEVLVAYEEPAQGKGEEDEEPPYAPTASFDDINGGESVYPCVCGDPHCSGCF